MSFSAISKRLKFWTQDILNGGKFWKDYSQSCRLMNNYDERSNSKRAEALNDILSYAVRNVKYYHNFSIHGSLGDFPVINKSTILSDYTAFIAPTEKIPGQKGRVHVQKTSGSTGTPFEILQDTRCRSKRLALIKAENEYIGFHSFDMLMHIRAVKHYWNFDGNILFKPELNIVYADNANLNDEKIEEIIGALTTYKVKFIRGYMTSLDIITRYIVEHNISLKYHPTFISVGELLLESLRTRIVNQLGCNVISQYANEESGVLGHSHINEIGTTIYLNNVNTVVEILKIDRDEPVEEGEIGRIVVTDLTNYAMPMIRYDTGDLAAIKEKTKDGTIVAISDLCGRKTDSIFKTNGDFIDMFNSMPQEIYNNPQIKQWQFTQNTESKYTLLLSVNDDSVKEKVDIFIELLKSLLGEDAEIIIQFTSQIPVLNSGKRRVVVSELNKN